VIPLGPSSPTGEAEAAPKAEEPGSLRDASRAMDSSRRWQHRPAGAWMPLLAAALVAAPFVIGTYWLGQVTLALIYVVATLGTDIVVGRSGMLSLCQASFIGLGAYVAAVGQAHGVPVVAQVLGIVALSAIAGAVVAIPTLKLSGLRLAIITLLFGELFVWAVDVNIGLTGGSEGMSVAPLQIGGFSTVSVTDSYILAAVVAVVATLVAAEATRGQWGRRLLTIRDTELAAASIGIEVRRTKVAAFMLGAVFCGIAGLLFGYTQGTVAPSTFDTFPSVYLLVAVLLGGAGSLTGSWLGAAYVALVPDAFSALGVPNLYSVLGGGVLVAFTLLMPGGLVSVPQRLGRLVGRNRTVIDRDPDLATTATVDVAGGHPESERRR